MQSELEIRMRLTQVKGYLRNFENKHSLDLEVSAEEYDVAENYVGERDALQWVLS